jgi:hypothetical protein
MDRKDRIALLVEHARNPSYEGVLEVADVAMPGGGPECGGSIVVYLRGDGNGRIEGLSFTGQGDTISMGAAPSSFRRYATRVSRWTRSSTSTTGPSSRGWAGTSSGAALATPPWA